MLLADCSEWYLTFFILIYNRILTTLIIISGLISYLKSTVCDGALGTLLCLTAALKCALWLIALVTVVKLRCHLSTWRYTLTPMYIGNSVRDYEIQKYFWSISTKLSSLLGCWRNWVFSNLLVLKLCRICNHSLGKIYIFFYHPEVKNCLDYYYSVFLLAILEVEDVRHRLCLLAVSPVTIMLECVEHRDSYWDLCLSPFFYVLF